MANATVRVTTDYARMRARFSLLWFDVSAVCVYLLSVVSLPGIAWRQKIVLFCIVDLFLLAHLRILVQWNRPVILVVAVAYGASVFASSYLNQSYGTSFLVTPLFFALAIVSSFLFVAYASLNGLMGRLLSLFFWLTLVLCLANDGLAVMQGIGKDGAYLLGNKFPASYIHMFLIALAYRRYVYTPRWRGILSLQLRMIVVYVYAIAFCWYMGCNTAVIWTLALGVLYIFQRVLLPVLRKPLVAVCTLIVADTLLIVNSAIVHWGPIQYLFTQMLGKSTDMTGRMPIYEKFDVIAQTASWHGVGMENTYTVSMMLTGAADVQNGLLHLLLSYGALGVVLFLVLQWICSKYIAAPDDPSMVMLVYAFIGISIVEIPFGKLFFIVLALMVCTSSSVAETRLFFKSIH